MKAFFKLFADSAKELNSVRALTGMSMLIALSLILNLVAKIPLSDSLQLGFSFLATALMGMLYGPVWAALGAGIVDILQAVIRPTGPFFFGFTLSAILSGLFFGLFLYKNKCTLPRIIISKTLCNVLIHLLLNSYWLTLLYGYAFWAKIPPRIIKNVAMLPVEILLMWLVLPQISKWLSRKNGENAREKATKA